jgi:hypothetical protein
LLEPKDYDLLVKAKEEVRSEIPYLSAALAIMIVMIAVGIFYAEVVLKFVDCSIGFLAFLNARSTLTKTIKNLLLIHELHMLSVQNKLSFFEDLNDYMMETAGH